MISWWLFLRGGSFFSFPFFHMFINISPFAVSRIQLVWSYWIALFMPANGSGLNIGIGVEGRLLDLVHTFDYMCFLLL
jgi:hypothetical protein